MPCLAALFSSLLTVLLLLSFHCRAELASPSSADSLPQSQVDSLSTPVPSSKKICEKIVNSETCSQFRLSRPDLASQFLTCDAKEPLGLAWASASSCGKGLWSAAQDYLSLFEAPELTPEGKEFLALQKDCFADKACREKAYRQGSESYFHRTVSDEEIRKLALIPNEQRLQVQPYYYGLIDQLRQMKARELELLRSGVDPSSPEGLQSMRESFPRWKPELRSLYAPPSWGESAQKTFEAIRIRLKDLGIELTCLDGPTVTEMLCFGAGYLVDPAVALKGMTVLPKAWKVLRTLMKSSGPVKSAGVLAVEAKWGRKLTADQLKRVQEAHLIGSLEEGANGGPASVGNYTWGQLRRKYLALKDDFNSSEIRDLMEEGAVGLTPQESSRLHADSLVQRPSSQSKTLRASQDKVLADFEKLDEDGHRLLMAQSDLNRDLGRFPEYQNFKKQLSQTLKEQDEVLGAWDSSSTQSTLGTQSEVSRLRKRMDKLQEEFDLWQSRRSTKDWGEIRNSPKKLVPDRVYQIKTDTGDEIKVVFNERVVREMVWETADDTRSEAGALAIKSIARGYRGQGNNGIAVISLDGEKFTKINIVGPAIGAYRIYGLERNGVIHFVNWERSSNHDSRFLRRALENTHKAYDNYSH